MADNGYTKTYLDGTALAEANLDTAYKSLKLDISNTTQLTSGSTSGHFLKSNGDSLAASFAAVPDLLGPFAIRNYGLSAAAAAGAITVALKTQAGSDPTTSNKVNVTFSNNGTTTGTYSEVEITAAVSIVLTASASLGITGTSTQRVFVYAVKSTSATRLGLSVRGDYDRAENVTTVAMGASADSADVLYATAALAVMPRLLGYFETAHNAAGAWQTVSRTNVTNTTDQRYSRRTTATTGSYRNVAISASSGSYISTSTTLIDVTNLSVTLTTTGNPVEVRLIPASGSSLGFCGAVGGDAELKIVRGSTDISIMAYNGLVPPGSVYHLDTPGPGTYVYKLQAKIQSGGTTVSVSQCKLVAQELT